MLNKLLEWKLGLIEAQCFWSEKIEMDIKNLENLYCK